MHLSWRHSSKVRSMKYDCCKLQYWVIKTPGASGEGEKKTVTERVVVMTDSPSPASRSCGSSTQWPRSAEADRNRRPPLWQASYWGPCSTEKDDARNDPRFLPTQTCTSRAFRIHAIHCCSQKKPKNPKKQKKKKKKNPAFLPAPEVLWIPNPKPKLKPAPEHCDNNFWRKRKQKQEHRDRNSHSVNCKHPELTRFHCARDETSDNRSTKQTKLTRTKRTSQQTKPRAWRVGGWMDEKLMDEKLVNELLTPTLVLDQMLWGENCEWINGWELCELILEH